MSIYRLNIDDNVEYKKNKKHIYVVEPADGYKKRYYVYECPFCKQHINAMDSYTCSENHKYYEGILFWRKYCKINNVHDHSICPKCKMHWIVKLSDYSKTEKIEL